MCDCGIIGIDVFKAINVGSGEATPIRDLEAIVVRFAGKELSLGFDGVYSRGDARKSFANLRKACHILGYSPRVPLQNGLKELAAWSRGQVAHDHVGCASVNSDIAVSLVYQLLNPCSRAT